MDESGIRQHWWLHSHLDGDTEIAKYEIGTRIHICCQIMHLCSLLECELQQVCAHTARSGTRTRALTKMDSSS